MKKNIYYISPSIFPSNSANSIHVINQCNAFANLNYEVTLYAKRSIKNDFDLKKIIKKDYGVDCKLWKLKTFFLNLPFADSFLISLISLEVILKKNGSLILSRNLYASFFLSLFNKKFIFETHQLETGFRKIIQKFIITKKNTRTVLISKKQYKYISDYHNMMITKYLIAHDCASFQGVPISQIKKKNFLSKITNLPLSKFENWNLICGYFGKLYSGRGLDIIAYLSKMHQDCLFVVCGSPDLNNNYILNEPNILYLGQVIYSHSRKLQKCMDILLMPYQKNVSIGLKGHDTAKWMSPLKMFEYLASGVPILSSNLPVLREVLVDKSNSILVEPDDIEAWSNSFDFLKKNHSVRSNISNQAYNLYLNNFTWEKRAKKIENFFFNQ